MPSDLIVKCLIVTGVRPHPNADSLLLVELGGWQIVTHKDTVPEIGDLRVFIPPDAVLPEELAVQLDVVKYLKKGNRVGQVRLRGEMSFGIAASNVWGFEAGEEVSEQLGITKYVPSPIMGGGDQEHDNPLFVNYSKIQNFRNYPNLFEDGEEVIMFEKIHGINSKVGIVYEDGEYIYMIGSHATRRKLAEKEDKNQSLYQYPLALLENMLMDIAISESANVVIAYGEIFGRVQNLKYGIPNKLDYRLIDLYRDGYFLDWNDVEQWTTAFSIETAPLVYRGPFKVSTMKDVANQNTLLMPPSEAHISEGVVIRPSTERVDPSIGRVILKYKSDAFEELTARGKATDYS
jgi:RNA ligase (TIGR02306 family)